MSDRSSPLSRRHFLSGLAVLGLTPFASVRAAERWLAQDPQFTGDDLAQAHELFPRGNDLLFGARSPSITSGGTLS